jgi:hypothetical protein
MKNYLSWAQYWVIWWRFWLFFSKRSGHTGNGQRVAPPFNYHVEVTIFSFNSTLQQCVLELNRATRLGEFSPFWQLYNCNIFSKFVKETLFHRLFVHWKTCLLILWRKCVGLHFWRFSQLHLVTPELNFFCYRYSF